MPVLPRTSDPSYPAKLNRRGPFSGAACRRQPAPLGDCFRRLDGVPSLPVEEEKLQMIDDLAVGIERNRKSFSTSGALMRRGHFHSLRRSSA